MSPNTPAVSTSPTSDLQTLSSTMLNQANEQAMCLFNVPSPNASVAATAAVAAAAAMVANKRFSFSVDSLLSKPPISVAVTLAAETRIDNGKFKEYNKLLAKDFEEEEEEENICLDEEEEDDEDEDDNQTEIQNGHENDFDEDLAIIKTEVGQQQQAVKRGQQRHLPIMISDKQRLPNRSTSSVSFSDGSEMGDSQPSLSVTNLASNLCDTSNMKPKTETLIPSNHNHHMTLSSVNNLPPTNSSLVTEHPFLSGQTGANLLPPIDRLNQLHAMLQAGLGSTFSPGSPLDCYMGLLQAGAVSGQSTSSVLSRPVDQQSTPTAGSYFNSLLAQNPFTSSSVSSLSNGNLPLSVNDSSLNFNRKFCKTC